MGWFGQGWAVQGLEQRLEILPQQDTIYLIDNSGRKVPFSYLRAGQSCYQPFEDITLYRLPYPVDFDQTKLPKPFLMTAQSISATLLVLMNHYILY